MIRWKSKVMDKLIKEIQESQCESDTWQDEDIPLDLLDQTGGKEGKEREEAVEREALPSL